MDFNFEALLVALTALTGVVWGWDKWRRRAAATVGEDAEDGGTGAGAVPRHDPWWLDMSRSLFPVILVVLIIRSFIVEPFRIPSGSMVPTLLPGDYILVNKFDYGLRLPVIHTKILALGEPKRGDVVVFRYPKNPSEDYIKRIVGLPGDHIRYVNKQLFINGKPMPQVDMGPGRDPGDGYGELRMENLNGVKHEILLHNGYAGREGAWVVPPHMYFAMGDNRDRSSDSRYWGFVPEKNIVGKAFLIWMSWDSMGPGVNWSRIGDRIH